MPTIERVSRKKSKNPTKQAWNEYEQMLERRNTGWLLVGLWFLIWILTDRSFAHLEWWAILALVGSLFWALHGWEESRSAYQNWDDKVNPPAEPENKSLLDARKAQKSASRKLVLWSLVLAVAVVWGLATIRHPSALAIIPALAMFLGLVAVVWHGVKLHLASRHYQEIKKKDKKARKAAKRAATTAAAT